jgi:outer membrane receptor protein involved in Fe transport
MTFVRDARVGITVHAKRCRGFIYAAVLPPVSALLMAGHLAQAGELDKVVALDIGPTTLDKALLQFGAQERLQIMFAWNSSTVSLPTREPKGSYTGKQALAEFLQGTRLTYIERGHTLEILPQASADSSPTARGRKLLEVQPVGDTKTSNRRASKSPDPQVINRQSQNGQPPRTLGEVVVTAQKYSQRAFDVPIDLDVVTSEELQARQITDLDSLQYAVPGLYVDNEPGTQRIFINGVSNDLGSGSLVGMYVDEADITAGGTAGQLGTGTGDLNLYDMQRVEVLKGPQGTLYGDGSLGGVIRFITNKPVLDHFEMNADLAAMYTEYGAPSQRIEPMLNIPLVEGTLAVRISGLFEHDGGWVDQPAANLKNVNSADVADVRAEALWQPTASVKINALQIVDRTSYGNGAGEDSGGNFTQVYGITLTPYNDDTFKLSNLTVTYDVLGAQLLSSSSYESHAENNYNSATYIQPIEFSELSGGQSTNGQFSEELRLFNQGAGPWQWTVGGFYKHYYDALGEYAYEGGTSLSSALFVSFPYPFQRELSNSLATFANTSYLLFDRLTLGAGVTYFTDLETQRTVSHSIETFVFPGTYTTGRFKSTDPRFYVQYVLTPEINTYVSASKGFRSGGASGVIGVPPYGPESMWTYTLGSKIRALNNRLRANVAVFYSKYSNYVVSGLVPQYGVFANVNGGAAEIKGVDADLTWRAADRWTFNLNGSYVDSYFVSIAPTVLMTGLTVNENLPYLLKYSFTASAQREFRWYGKPGYVQLYGSQTGPVSAANSYGEGYVYSDTIRQLGLSSGIQWSDSLKIGLFAQNLLNDRGYLGPTWIDGTASRPRPRTFGFDFSASFGD